MDFPRLGDVMDGEILGRQVKTTTHLTQIYADFTRIGADLQQVARIHKKSALICVKSA